MFWLRIYAKPERRPLLTLLWLIVFFSGPFSKFMGGDLFRNGLFRNEFAPSAILFRNNCTGKSQTTAKIFPCSVMSLFRNRSSPSSPLPSKKNNAPSAKLPPKNFRLRRNIMFRTPHCPNDTLKIQPRFYWKMTPPEAEDFELF